MPQLRITVAVPTLVAGEPFAACLASLENQSARDFEVIVVDNSGKRLVPENARARVIYNTHNVGFGAAINQAISASTTPFIATLNDDAVAGPQWLEALVDAIEQRRDVGMCASQVRLADNGLLDSAGMLLCLDGSSKQRGHRESPQKYPRLQEVLLPSGSAAMYRRDMLEEIGLFDESFFLYCEDTDLGLRARWAGWECFYVPDALVEHNYSHSAGRASPLKALYVERNRLLVAIKNFPVDLLMRVPVYESSRYFWHVMFGLQGRGAAAEFRRDGNNPGSLPVYVLQAHAAVLRQAPRLWAHRRTMKRRLTSRQFRGLLARWTITPRQVARL